MENFHQKKVQLLGNTQVHVKPTPIPQIKYEMDTKP